MQPNTEHAEPFTDPRARIRVYLDVIGQLRAARDRTSKRAERIDLDAAEQLIERGLLHAVARSLVGNAP